MKSAVTGGSGVVGSAVVRDLVASGHEVIAVARSSQAAAKLTGLGARTIEGDILDAPSIDRLVAGCDWVFHIAGVNEMCSKHPDRMSRVNVDGTRIVMEASRRAGVARLVHTSSAVTLGELPGEIGSEMTNHRGFYLSQYERSKQKAEQLLLEQAADLDVVIVNPSSVQGPGRASGTGKLILDVLNGKLPFLIDARISLVDIDDCARGHQLAAERGAAGERYVLSALTSTVKDLVLEFAEATGSGVSVRYLPVWAATAGGALVEVVARIAGRQPPVCRDMIRVLRAGAAYDGSRATRELGLKYRPLGSMIERTVAWFRSEGLLI